MKKGQKVRVLADNRIGIIADSHFVYWGGKKLIQYQVKFPDTKGEAPWFPSDRLTTVLEERAVVSITGEKGRINFTYTVDHDSKHTSLEIKSDNLANRQPLALHTFLANALLDGLSKFHDFSSATMTVQH